MNDNNDIIKEAEMLDVESQIEGLLNSGLKICCPKCHSADYDFWHTGIAGANPILPEEDLHYICKTCTWIWNSEFMGAKYGYKKSILEGYRK